MPLEAQSRARINNPEPNIAVRKPGLKSHIPRPVLGEISNKGISTNAPKEIKHTGIFHHRGQVEREINPLAVVRLPNIEGLNIRQGRTNKNRRKIGTSELPPGVEDIDKDDLENIYSVPQYANDIYKYLRDLEEKFTVKENFLENCEITAKMRSILINWLVDVQTEYKLLQETFQTSVSIVDRYLQVVHSVTRDNLQLVGITALFIAGKYIELYPPELKDYIYISDSAYTPSEVLQMECQMLSKLNFSIGKPVAIVFLRRYSKAAQAQALHHAYGKYIIDLALLDYSLCHVKPSLIAAAATFISLCLVSGKISEINRKLWTKSLEYYSTYEYNHFSWLIPKLAKLVRNSSQSKFKAIFLRYNSHKLMRVSLLPAGSIECDIIEYLCLFQDKKC